MNLFNPDLCVSHKRKPEHYNLKDVQRFAKAAGLTTKNIKLGKTALCDKLKEKYRNGHTIQVNDVKERTLSSKTKTKKNLKYILENRSPLKSNIRKNPQTLKKNILSTIKKQTLCAKTRTKQRTLVAKSLQNYFRNRKYIYNPVEQVPNYFKNPLKLQKYSQGVINSVKVEFGEKKIENFTQEEKIMMEIANEAEYMKAVIEYKNYKNHQNILVKSITVPKTWKPMIGNKNLKIADSEKLLTCSLKPNLKIQKNTLVYIDIEVENNTILHVYDVNSLKMHMKTRGYVPSQRWKQLQPKNIKSCHPKVIEEPDVIGLLLVRELQKIHNNNILEIIEKMLRTVHRIENKDRVVIHAQTTNNIKERRGNCGLSIMILYDFIQEQKTKAEKVALLKELGQSLPICIEAKCNFIREFVEEKKGGFMFNYNSSMPKDRIIADACIFYIKKWCKESESKANARQFFLGKLPDLFTRVQGKLQNINSRNGKIDYKDILRVIIEQGEYMVNCGNHNFKNINLNTEKQKRQVFGMIGVV